VETETIATTKNQPSNTQAAPSSGMSTADLVSATKGASPATTGEAAASSGNDTPLFSQDDTQTFRDQWTSIQASFVDDPRQAAQHADELVAQVIQRLAQMFADERSTLEQQWSSGKDVSTEDLRVALQRYRSFFDRLLSV
jgi:hypothetical protein